MSTTMGKKQLIYITEVVTQIRNTALTIIAIKKAVKRLTIEYFG